MTQADDQLRGVDDPRLAVHATSARPAWLWTLDGTRIIWANPVGARVFGAGNSAVLAATSWHPADGRRRQIAKLAQRLDTHAAPRLERLRGFGEGIGTLTTCVCSRLEFADGSSALLIVAAAPVTRPMPLVERLQRLVEGVDTPMASFAPDGLFVGASEAARTLIGFHDLSNGTMAAARRQALAEGRAELPIGIGHIVLQRVGAGAEVALVARLVPGGAGTTHAPSQPQADQPSEPIAPPEAAEPTAAAAPGAAVTVPDDDAATNLAPDLVTDLALAGPDRTDGAGGPSSAEQAPTEPVAAAPQTTEHGAASAMAPSSGEELEAEQPRPAMDEVLAAEPTFATAAEPIEDTSPPATDPSAEQTRALEPPTAVHGQPEVVQGSAAQQPAPSTDVPAPGEPAAAEEDRIDHDHAAGASAKSEIADHAEEAAAWYDEPLQQPRRHPLRFTWQLDAEERFSIGSDEFSRLIGPRTAAGFGRPWHEIADLFRLDPDGRFAAAIASRRTWSGVVLEWPVDDPQQRLMVEMSGLPTQDRDGQYIGYRGFGVCRDLDALDRLAALRRGDHPAPMPTMQPLSADRTVFAATELSAIPIVPPTVPDMPLDTPPNVLPFRPANDDRALVLTPVENNAFDELARQLSARLQSEGLEAPAEPTAAPIATSDAPVRATAENDRMLIDLLPFGVLIYRLDRLIHANGAFLQRMGFASLEALQAAGGVDALLVETESGDNHEIDVGSVITIRPAHASAVPCPPATARLHAIEWDDEPALALILSAAPEQTAHVPSIVASPPSAAGHASAEELAAILDGTPDAIVMFDHEGRITVCNRSAETMFGYRGDELVQMTFAELFAPASRDEVQQGLKNLAPFAADTQPPSREWLGRTRTGDSIPLLAMVGRTSADGLNSFAVLRDLSQQKKTEAELAQTHRQADRAAGAKTDALSRLSHEIRIPLNAMLGFAEVMIEERFGPLGNERYAEYMKDIRASGERVIAIVDDLLELSRIESGQIDLALRELHLNETVEQCVATLQPHANRARIIMRSSLAQQLPVITADAPSLRQIVTNLITTSIQLANAGGQVIISTALSDGGEVMLRVRDTGDTLNEDELAAAMQPFRSTAPSDASSEASAVSLSLTRALVEANRGRFQIKTAPHSGTLIEVIFAPATKA